MLSKLMQLMTPSCQFLNVFADEQYNLEQSNRIFITVKTYKVVQNV